MNNKIVRISALCVLMSACAFATKENNSNLKLNEVVFQILNLLWQRKVGKVM
jgi:hypothetical protein